MLAQLGVDLDAVLAQGRKRPVLRCCLDWSEQRHHVAGRVGAALLDAFLEQGWVERRPHDRAVTVTAAGEAALDAVERRGTT